MPSCGCRFPEGAAITSQPCASHREVPDPHVKQQHGQKHLPANSQVAAHQCKLCTAADQLRHQRWCVLRCVNTAQPDSAAALSSEFCCKCV